jgi:TPR repeat protein
LRIVIKRQLVVSWEEKFISMRNIRMDFPDTQIATLKDSAALGDAKARLRLGGCYERGEGVEQNSSKAENLYKLAAEQGLVEAQLALGHLYVGIVENIPEGAQWFRKAAEQGNMEAKYWLGICLHDLENYEESLKWYVEAANQGYDQAQNELGNLYEMGECGVALDYVKAAKWYSLAAEQGNSGALVSLFHLFGYLVNERGDLASTETLEPVFKAALRPSSVPEQSLQKSPLVE